MSERNELVGAVGVAGAISLAVLGIVGRRSYKRKIVQLTKELAKEGKSFDANSPPKVWAVLSPQETMKVFMFPLFVVMSGTSLVGYSVKKVWGIRDMQHGMDTLRWIARVGPPPS